MIAMEKKYQVEPYRNFAQPYYVSRDTAHDFRHIERILSRLETFLVDIEQPLSLDRLYFLACFHGLGKRLQTDIQLEEGAKAFLRGLDWSETDIEEGFQSLARHLVDPQTPEEKIIHDANYLEILGAFGIAKAFTVGGARGQHFEETANIFEQQYLEKVEFQTATGKRLALEGREYTREFLRRLRSEW
jgi:uncharacterized protein